MILHDPATLERLLRRHGLRADKGLGQHFLVSEPVVLAILDALGDPASVLEIGPGPGVLTRPASERFAQVRALELDPRFVSLLSESAPKAEVRQGDVMTADLASLLDDLARPRAVLGNLPYYITSPILQRLTEVREAFDRAVVMIQREVADRVMAPAGDGERGSFSVFLQAHFEIRRVISVPASAFAPPPKVASTVLTLTPKPAALDAATLELVRVGFVQPRKTLANNLMAARGISRDSVLDLIEGLGFSEKVRAQELEESQWIELAQALK